MPETLWNWNKSAKSEPAVVRYPATVEELRNIVKNMGGEYPSPVRPAGERHSVNPCFAADGGTQVCMDNFMGHVVDERAQTITVGAGATLVQIRDWLRPYNLELPVSPEIGNATAGSVACAGTKDSSLFKTPPVTGHEDTFPPGFGQVGSAVTEIEMVDADGNSVTASEAANPARLRDIRSSYGLLGIIHKVKFQAVPLVPLHYSHEWIPFDQNAPPTIDRIFGEGTHAVLGFFQPYRRGILVERRRLAPGATISETDRLKRQVRDWLWEWGASEATTGLTTLGKIIEPFDPLYALRSILDGVTQTALGRVAAAPRGPTSKLLTVFDVLTPEILVGLGGFNAYRSDSNIHFTPNRLTFFDFTFWAYPVRRWQQVVSEYIKFCEDFRSEHDDFRPSLFTEVYFIARDDRSALAFAPDHHVFTLDMVHNEPDAEKWKVMNRDYNTKFAVTRGRPLLNQTKQLEFTPEVVSQALAGWAPFKARLTPAEYERFCKNTFFDQF